MMPPLGALRSVLLKVTVILAASFGLVTLVHAPLHDALLFRPESLVKPGMLPLPAHLEVPETDEAKHRGLSGRAELPPDYGMLFFFEEEGRYGFWMKEMLIPIDIVWIDATGTIVGIEHGLSPETYPDVFYPPAAVRYVLEVAAGYAKEHGLETGKRFALPAEGTSH